LVGETGRGPHVDAPPFRTLSEAKLYAEGFGQRLQNGLSTIPPHMPSFQFNRSDAEAVVNDLEAIQTRKTPK
jgi:hypothetical protein